MSNPYEVEHNVQPPTRPAHRRRPDMASFTSHLHQISGDPSSPSEHRPHALPTPVDMASMFRLVQDQFGTLAADAPNEANRTLLQSLMAVLESDIDSPPDRVQGVPEEFLATLDRIKKDKLKKDESCPICAEPYLDDQYPLVVELPCSKDHGHRFDLECVGPWLQSKGTCPMCRTDFTKKKEAPIVEDSEEDEDPDGMYG